MDTMDENSIPAFSMWKMITDTIPDLLKMDSADNCITKVAKIITSKEYSNIFVFNKDPALSHQQYKDISNIYKAFTVWILGRFFYMSSCERLSAIHNIIIDVQTSILDQVSKRLSFVYMELVAEYGSTLHSLSNYLKKPSGKLILNVFVPKLPQSQNINIDLSTVPIEINNSTQCQMILLKVLKVFNYIYKSVFMLHKFDESTSQNFDDFIFLLSCSMLKIKFEVLNIYNILISKDIIENHCTSHSLISKLQIMFTLCEQLIYDIYLGNIEIEQNDFGTFESHLVNFFNISYQQKFNIEKLCRIAEFICDKSVHNNGENKNRLPSKLVQNSILPLMENREEISTNKDISKIFSDMTISNSAILLISKYKRIIIKDILKYYKENETCKNILVYEKDVCDIWYNFIEVYISKANGNACRTSTCFMKELLSSLIEISSLIYKFHLELSESLTRNNTILTFFNEPKLFYIILSKLEHHLTSCDKKLDVTLLLDIFSVFPFLTNSKNCDLIFHILAYPFLKPTCYQSDDQLPKNVVGASDTIFFKNSLNKLYSYLSLQNINKATTMEYFFNFFKNLTSGLFIDFNRFQMESTEAAYFQINRQILTSPNEENTISYLLDSLLHSCTIFNDNDMIQSHILTPILSNCHKTIKMCLMRLLPTLICISYSDYIKVSTWNAEKNSRVTSIYCNKCFLEDYDGNIKKFLEDYFPDESYIAVSKFKKSTIDLSPIAVNILNNILSMHKNGYDELKIAAINCFSSCSSHIIKFHAKSIANLWLDAAGDKSCTVRKKFNDVIFSITKNGQESNILSNESKKEVLELTLNTILELTKKSLKFSDFELQNTLLSAIEEISSIKCEQLILPAMEILVYFIMFPTSKYSLIAVNRFFTLAKKQNTNSELLYLQYKKELCKVIVHLCAVNQQVINYDLDKSLSKVSLVLGFHGTKDFVCQACQYLLPFFIAKVIKMPKVSELIDETAKLNEVDLSELLASKYGNIFLHAFLNESKEDFKECMAYLEKNTNHNGATLRKRNFRIILNELLLNFHNKRDRVILALTLLSKEENENNPATIPDYLQSKFLGILLYFDMKLIDANCTSKDDILKSLADIFVFMGSRHVTPLRFKIVAMLTTANCKNYPELHCKVWESFIKSCEIEMLGPQLARIVVFLLPQIEHCPDQVNSLLRYLFVENEVYTMEHIKDLFFVDNSNVDEGVLSVIKKYSIASQNKPLREKIKAFLKYLTHETLEVRIQGFKHLKILMEENRKELDQMILGYNGIDPIVVELIEILSSACREKDDMLRLVCGELIGELGAVEPSHLPRRYAQDTNSFTFFMNEDAFLISTLNELTKAFQAENNTQNTDRFALAIQEILKAHEITPDQSSSKNSIWKQLSSSQQQIVTPFLTSRYMIAQSGSKNHSCPIYGSSLGTSFESWLYNWTSCLIADLPSEKKSLMELCLPSMKLNQRILMHFLPHIFLHGLIEGNDGCVEKCYLEMTTVMSSSSSEKLIDSKILETRPLPIPGLVTETPSIAQDEVKQTQCLKVVFVLLNFIDRWLREWQWQKGLQGRSNSVFKTVKAFYDRFCKLSLARSNYQCQEYPRALMYLEDYVNENDGEVYNNLFFFAEIYAQLDEADGVAGVTALQHSEPSIEQRILALEVCGKLADAAACYEKITPPLKLHHLQGLTQCYLDLDNVNTALNFAQGAIDLQPEFGNVLLELQAEPLWRLGRYDELDSLVSRRELANNKNWGVQIGKALIGFKQDKRDEFKNVLQILKRQQVECFGAANLEEGAYQHGYHYISKLHGLAELEQVEKCIHELLIRPNDNNSIENIMKELTNEWEMRIKVVQESARIIEPLLCLRRVAIDLAKNVISKEVPQAIPFFDSLLGELWLRSARTARHTGNYQQAYTYTLKAEEYAPPKLFLEKAKLHWLREEHEQALTTLKRGVDLINSGGSTQTSTVEERKLCAEAKLLTATYNDSTSNVDTDVNIQHYKEAVEVYKEWEKSLVSLAQYYDRIFQNMTPEDQDSKGTDMQLHMINFFGKSLMYGTIYVYQSMPRMLSIWFDYGTRLLDVSKNPERDERKASLLKMTKLIDFFLDRLPSYIFLTAFSQLVSRICHPQKEVYIELKSIIIKLLLQYPQQTLWMIISVIKSDYAVRSKRCSEILNDPRLKSTSMTKLVKDFTLLAEKLIELCNKEIADVSTTTVSAILRSLPRMLNKGDFSEIMIPTHKFRKLVLPNPDFTSSQHNPFPNHYVHIAGIEDEVTILASLQKPRKISFRGSDGRSYTQMLKPKDDLRKDFRLMEFNDIVNQLLAREPEARQRRLNIRLYSVAPLNEECGLIEWVPNLVGFRPILMNLYKQKGLGMKGKELKESCCSLRDPLAKKREVFTNILLRKHPPVLSEWFRKTFPDAQNWFIARTAYIRTTAVMSMVGYILGLGDRHGENISLDSICGDIVHVDFNCLFNKGESFEWPERVPFRLTQNMVSAMGPLGVEGMFRKSCACTLRVLRSNATTLMSTVTPFVYDPLVDWPRNAPSSHAHNAERTNGQAVEHIKNIELRLSGIVKTKSRSLSIPLSVDGQTNNLINEAINTDNLCQMYIGWGPYL